MSNSAFMCPTCHRRIVEIGVRVGDTIVTMHACSACGTRWWDHDGEEVGLENVLELAAAASSALGLPAD